MMLHPDDVGGPEHPRQRRGRVEDEFIKKTSRPKSGHLTKKTSTKKPKYFNTVEPPVHPDDVGGPRHPRQSPTLRAGTRAGDD